MNKKYNTELLKIKALTVDDDLINGYYIGNGYFHFASEKLLYPETPEMWEINPYTICRNTGIKDKNNHWVYEYDLLILDDFNNNNYKYGYIEWSEFYKQWIIKNFTEYGGHEPASTKSFEVVGNIILNDTDAQIIFEQDKKEQNRDYVIDTSYCPSKFRQ